MTCLAAIMVAAAVAITACESFNSLDLSDELQSGGNATLSVQYHTDGDLGAARTMAPAATW